MPENKSCANCGVGYTGCAVPLGGTYCNDWQPKSADPRGENYHKPTETMTWGQIVIHNTEGYIPEKWTNEITAAVEAEITAAEKRGAEKEREISKSLYLALSELQALVMVNVPSLLNEDSGVDSKLDMEIADALKNYEEGK